MSKTEKAPFAALDSSVPKAPARAEVPTKSATVLALLHREAGATLAELIEATGWQPHTTRTMLTGLRKKGHAIERDKRDDVTCYHLPIADA
jgi:DNA-binding MarR family transcriptional regulator